MDRWVTATPDAGYHFVSWSDGVLTAARTDTNVTANIEVTANFAINSFTLTYTRDWVGTLELGTSPQTVDYGSDGTGGGSNGCPGIYRLSLRQLE